MGNNNWISYEEYWKVLELIKKYGDTKVPDSTYSDNACSVWSDITSVLHHRNANMTDVIDPYKF